jgi:hypothetical protein
MTDTASHAVTNKEKSVSIRIYDPTGNVQQAHASLAKRPSASTGLRIAILDNKKTNAGLLLASIAENLSERHAAHLTVVAGKASAAVPVPDDVVERIRLEADLVLTGSAD